MKQQGVHPEDAAGTPDAAARPDTVRADTGDPDARREESGPRKDDLTRPRRNDGGTRAREDDGAAPDDGRGAGRPARTAPPRRAA
ncbi:hypothetical protein ABT272_27685, partial [Streptomyces sp900105245]